MARMATRGACCSSTVCSSIARSEICGRKRTCPARSRSPPWADTAAANSSRYSDVDLLVLLPHEPDAALKAKLEALIGGLWDMGLELGHGVRTIEECVSESAKDITVQTSLLEARWLAGSRGLFTAFSRAMHEQLDPQAFFQSKRLEQEQRYGKFQESPYSLEPNCKEAPGGLRDLQAILWISRAAGLGDNWMQLAARELITAAEARQLASYQKFLSELRIRLHYIAGRREDRLLFDYQSGLAAQFGYIDTPTKRASEQLMQRYYRTAKAITQLNTLLLQNIAVRAALRRGCRA